MIASSPAIRRSDGLVFFATLDASDSRVYAYDPATGAPKWHYSLLHGPYGMHGTYSSPALSPDGGRLYIGDENGYLYALNATTGSPVWSPQQIGGAIRSSPAVATNLTSGTETIWVTSDDGNLYGLKCTSGGPQLLMSTPVGAGSWMGVARVPFTSSPVVGADGTVYVASLNGIFYAIRPTDAAILWSLTPTGNPFIASPAIGPDGTIYVSDFATLSTSTLVAIDPSTKGVKWSYTFPSSSAEGQAVVDRDGTIYVGTDDSYLYALTPTGTLAWDLYVNRGAILASPALTSDGYAYVVTFSFFPPCVINLATHEVVNEADPALSASVYFSSPAIASDGSFFVATLSDYDHDDPCALLWIQGQSPNSTPALGFYPKFRSTNRNSGNAGDNRWTERPIPVATITDLYTFDWGLDESQGYAINDLDFATGWSQNAWISSFYKDAFLYNPAIGGGPGLIDLGHMYSGNTQTTGLGMNVNNVVVGYQQNYSGQTPAGEMAFAWTQTGGMVSLNPPGTQGSFYAYGINRAGSVVGFGYPYWESTYHALYWPNPNTTVYTSLGSLNQDYASYAYGINDNGWVVGKGYVSSTTYHAFAVEPNQQLGPLWDLGTMSGNPNDNSAAFAINGLGQIVGTSGPANESQHVFLKNHRSAWGSGFQDLGISYYPNFAAINGRGQVVTDNGRIYVPALSTTLQPLANYLSPSDQANWRYIAAEGISSDGTITGRAMHYTNGAWRWRAFIIQVR